MPKPTDEDGAEGLPGSRLLTRQERWRQRNPEAHRAHEAVKYALRAGRLSKQPCEVCGAPGEAHHPNYNKPLLIQWLCRIHHKRVHQRKLVKVRGEWKVHEKRTRSDRC